MIEVISKEKSSKIIDTRKPYGSFLLLNKDGSFTGIDNTAGEAFTEDFKNLKNCLEYLNGADLEECLEFEK
ncbi:hypothetical protein ACJDU8_15565 [Clostridium sp. WILCCON 0269]|uniref:Uncharacterized protein n=1 Tax=Candidatus Clostridium eludens TaxID=3381663 RepID=A0ABW8SQL0_9CLOT